MLDLVTHWPILVVCYLLIVHVVLGFGLVDCLLDSLLEIQDFVINKVLVNFHFLLEILHLTFVDQLEDAGARVFNSLDALFFKLKDFAPDLCLEASMALVMDGLSLQVEKFCLSFCELETFKISIHEGSNEVKPVVLVKLPKAVDADSLLVIEAEEI